jgi:hypothetical protein
VGVRCLDFTGTALVLSAPSTRVRLTAAIYAVSVAALFGSSALYHRVAWRSPASTAIVRVPQAPGAIEGDVVRARAALPDSPG